MRWNSLWTDGTIARKHGWSPNVEASSSQVAAAAPFVWADDSFMGLALVARVAATTGVVDNATAAQYADFVAQQHADFHRHLGRPLAGAPGEAFFHGWHGPDNATSCCLWSRANGWAVLSSVEVLAALEARGHAAFPAVRAAFAAHVAALAALLGSDGRLHQLVNDTGTFEETSGTAMLLIGLLEGAMRGWVDEAKFAPTIARVWQGLVDHAINTTDGTVSGICKGFGVPTPDVPARYADACDGGKCSYYHSQPGLGSVLRAAVLMHQWQQRVVG